MTARTRAALIVDVDGVVSPLDPAARVWGDETVAGNVLGPVTVSPALCARLDAIRGHPGRGVGRVSAWRLTSWTVEMRAAMDPFPGRR